MRRALLAAENSFRHPNAASAAEAAIDFEELMAQLEAAPFQTCVPWEFFSGLAIARVFDGQCFILDSSGIYRA
jgi:hypothetical protein